MQPYYDEDGITIYNGDCRAVLPQLPAGSVHCCVTSPPYWGLRDYGTGTWEGGDEGCDHSRMVSSGSSTLKNDGRPAEQVGWCDADYAGKTFKYRDVCGKCGARRIDSQIGLESSLDEYVATMVEVFRQVRRVLRDDGTLWLNLGDAYASQGARVHGGWNGDSYDGGNNPQRIVGQKMGAPMDLKAAGLKPKDLCGIPWRVAFALQADGWYLRQDIIWHKPNPMPESVTDRCTKAHEYVFLLSKSARYYFDADAIREDSVKGDAIAGARNYTGINGRERLSQTEDDRINGRNRRSVWTIPTQPYAAAHFATFPQKLIEPCIKAGCPEGGVVLDPFLGSGTTAYVARRLSNKAVCIELSEEYMALVVRRLRQRCLF